MDEISEISSSIKLAICNVEDQKLVVLANKFCDFLIDNFENQGMKNLNNQKLLDFELCCSLLEFEILHNKKEPELSFVINEVSDNYEQLTFLKTRMICLRYPDKIGHIKSEWKNSLKNFIIDFLSLNSMSSKILTPEGKKVFINRVGVKVLSQVQTQLKRINLSSELPGYLSTLILNHKNDNDDVIRIMKLLTNNINDEFKEGLVNSNYISKLSGIKPT